MPLETDSIPDESQLDKPEKTDGPSKQPRLAADQCDFDHAQKMKHVWLSYDENTCKLGTKYHIMPRNRSGKWITTGCMVFGHDKVLAHENSVMHKEALRARADQGLTDCKGEEGMKLTLQLPGKIQIGAIDSNTLHYHDSCSY